MKWLSFSPALWRAGISAAIGRFPFAILCGAIGSACAIVGIHFEKNEELGGQCARLAMTVALGLPLFFTLRILRERETRPARIPLELIGVAVLAVWLLVHSARPFDEPGIVFVRSALVLASLHFLAALSPYLRGGEGPGFWQFNRQVFLRFCLATLYTGVLTIGLELALLSADKLFDLNLRRAYADLWFLMIGCFHPTFFLAGVPRDFAQLEAETQHPRGLKAFTQFALAPLVLVYGSILYAYALKIVLLRSWPRGWVALPVLILSGVGIFASLLLHPLRNDPQEKWAVWFGRVFPRALAPLALLLLLSLRIRIADYGVTEERYGGVVAGVWILAWSIVFIVRRNARIRWIPASLAIICVLTAFGPWSAGAISKRSQLTRIAHMLEARGLWTGSQAKAPPNTIALPHEEGVSLRSTISYLTSMHGAAALRPIFGSVLPQLASMKAKRSDEGSVIMDALKLVVADDVSSRSYTRKQHAALDVAGFRRAWQVSLYGAGGESPMEPEHCDDIAIAFDHAVLTVAIGNQPPSAPAEVTNSISKLLGTPAGEIADEQSSVDFERGGRSFRIVFTSLQMVQKRDGPRVTAAQLFLLER
jgi:hypothetical protein